MAPVWLWEAAATLSTAPPPSWRYGGDGERSCSPRHCSSQYMVFWWHCFFPLSGIKEAGPLPAGFAWIWGLSTCKRSSSSAGCGHRCSFCPGQSQPQGGITPMCLSGQGAEDTAECAWPSPVRGRGVRVFSSKTVFSVGCDSVLSYNG